jgi:hypothetical protein
VSHQLQPGPPRWACVGLSSESLLTLFPGGQFVGRESWNQFVGRESWNQPARLVGESPGLFLRTSRRGGVISSPPTKQDSESLLRQCFLCARLACPEHFTNVDSCRLQSPDGACSRAIPIVQLRKLRSGWLSHKSKVTQPGSAGSGTASWMDMNTRARVACP